MIYAYLVAAIALISAGWSACHYIDGVEIQRLENEIAAANTRGELTLATEQERVNQASAKALQANQQLDSAHEQSIETINALRDRLDAVSLRDVSRRACGGGTSAAGTGTGKPEAQAQPGELSTEFSGFLKSRFYDADRSAEYANECYRFVVEQNCGIER